MYYNDKFEIIHEKEDVFFLIKENIYNKLKSPTEAKEIFEFISMLIKGKKENFINLNTFHKNKNIIDLLKNEQVKEIDFVISDEYLSNLLDNLLLSEDRKDTIIEQIFNSPYLNNEDKIHIHNIIEYQIDRPYVPNFSFDNLKDLANNFNRLNVKTNIYSSSMYFLETIKENKDVTNLNKKIEEIITVLSFDGTKYFNEEALNNLKMYYLNILEKILQDKFLREAIEFPNIEKSLYQLEQNLNYSNSEFIKFTIKDLLNYYFLFPSEKQRLKFDGLRETREFLAFVDIKDLSKEKQSHLFSKLKLNLNKQNYEDIYNLLKRDKILNPVNKVFLWFNKECNFDIKTDINYKKFFNFLNLYSDIIIKNNDLFEFISEKLDIKESLTDNSYIYNLMFKNSDFNNTFFIETNMNDIQVDIETGFFKSSERFDNNLNLLFLYYSNINLMNDLFINDNKIYKELTELLQQTSFIFKNEIVKPDLSKDFFSFYEKNINRNIQQEIDCFKKSKNFNFKIDYISNLVKFKLLEKFDFDDEEVLRGFNYNQEIFEILIKDFRFLLRDKQLFLDIYRNCNSEFLINLSNKINRYSEVETKLNTEIIEEIVNKSKDVNNFVIDSIIQSLKTHNLYKNITTDMNYEGLLQEIKKQGKEKGIKFNF